MNENRNSLGFTMTELLVALVVGALMTYVLFNAQQYSMYQAGIQKNTWEDLNLTQELMASRSLPEISRPTGTWLHSERTPGFKWRTQSSQEPDDLAYWTELATDINGVIFKWSWPVPE